MGVVAGAGSLKIISFPQIGRSLGGGSADSLGAVDVKRNICVSRMGVPVEYINKKAVGSWLGWCLHRGLTFIVVRNQSGESLGHRFNISSDGARAALFHDFPGVFYRIVF